MEAPLIDGAVRRPYWFRLSRLARLYHQGKITDTAYETGCCWRSDFEMVCILTMPQPALDRIPGGGGGTFYPPSLVLDAARRLRQAAAIIPKGHDRLLIDVLVDDLSWRSLAKLWKCSEATLQGHVVTLLNKLERVYAHVRQPD